MRTFILTAWLIGTLACGTKLHAQTFEMQELLLDIQKLAQEKQLLNDLYKGYEILSKGYGAIRDVTKGSFNLHKDFLDGLLAVSPAVKNYTRIADIISLQERILQEYTTSWSRFKKDSHFTPDELVFIGNVYSGLFSQTVKNLTDLTNMLTDGVYRASDAERLEQIDDLYRQMQGSQLFMSTFGNRTALLSLQRSADQNDYNTVKQLYGLNT